MDDYRQRQEAKFDQRQIRNVVNPVDTLNKILAIIAYKQAGLRICKQMKKKKAGQKQSKKGMQPTR